MLLLGEELLLVAFDEDKGVLRGTQTLKVGLNAAGLAELAASGWLLLRKPGGGPGLTVLEGGDPEVARHRLMAEMLRQIQELRPSERHPETYLKNRRLFSLYSHLETMRKNGIIAWDKPKNRAAVYGRFHILDTEAAAAARARIERVAAGAAPSERDLDLAGILHGLGLDKVLYKGWRNRSKRGALAAAVAGQRFATLVAKVAPEILGQKFTFDSRNDLKMARDMFRTADIP